MSTNPEIFSLSQHNKRFRDNFWLKTVLRFFAIEEFLRKTETREILHIEGDVWISKDFPIEIIEKVSPVLAYPLKSLKQGIASTVYIPNLTMLAHLNRFIIESFRIDAFSTDVSILGAFHQKFPDYFYNLPTALPRDDFYLSDKSTDELKVLSKNYEVFGGLFDASSLGIYYTGIDPRNNWGWRDLFVGLDHKIDFKNSTFEMREATPILKYKDSFSPIFSLHIHSKDERFFNYPLSIKRMAYISRQNQRKRHREFSFRETPKILLRTAAIKSILYIRDTLK